MDYAALLEMRALRKNKERKVGETMNRNKKGIMPDITRDVYKNVKKFDRQQFTQFCTDLYKFGYEDGYEAGFNNVPAVDVEKIYEVIEGIKGIGPVKIALIKSHIDAAFGGEKHDGT